jgi:hypothetical protein
MTDLARAAVLTGFGQPLEVQEFLILDPERDRLVGPGRYSLDDATLALQRTSDLEETKVVILPGPYRLRYRRLRSGGVLPEPAPGGSIICQLRISPGARPGANISRPRVSPRARARRTAA